jgi:RNA polymerase sigma factor (sigma-70 family)
MTLPPFQALLDEHAADLHRFLVASAGVHDGADAFQETVIAALRAYPGLRNDDNLRGWLFTIAHRKVIDGARARTRRAVPVPDVPDAGVVERDGTGDAALWAAVRELPPKQRSAVVQRYLLDRPYAEIAQTLECTEAAARQNVRAGLQRLRRGLPEEVTA